MKKSLVLCCVLVLMFGVAGSIWAFPNGGFESDFAGWNTIGDTSIQQAAYGTGPTKGQRQALMTSGQGSVSNDELETALEVAPGALDQLALKSSPETGSAIWMSLTVNPGDILTFDWNFLTNESIPDTDIDDFGFWTLSTGEVTRLAGTYYGSSSFSSSPTSSFEFETGFQQEAFTFTNGGIVTLGFGVVNSFDNAGSSGLLIDNIQLSSAVPEPGTIILLGIGLLGLLGLDRKRVSKE